MTVSFHELLLVFVSIVIGVVIGIEREYRNKSAGLRTLMLVCVGSCIFTLLSGKMGGASPDRIAANIVTGIGFLGAGVIFKDENKISGITTASTIWIVAALGMAVGSNQLWLAFIGAMAVLLVLWLLIYIEIAIDKLNRVRNYKITCLNDVEKYGHYEKIFKEHKLRFERLSQLKTHDMWTGNWKISGTEKQHNNLAKRLLKDDNIESLQF